MNQVYCVQTDVEFVWSQVGVIFRTDDRNIGITDAPTVTNGIDCGAADMNARIERRYPDPSVLASNAWCRWTNAWFAAYYLGGRRGNAPPQMVKDQYADRLNFLDSLIDGKTVIPGAPALPGADVFVSNYSANLIGPGGGSVARNPFTSTGPASPPGVHSTPEYYLYFWQW